MPAADPPPPPPTGDGFIAYLLGLPRELRPAALAQLGPLERESFDRDWASWAHNGQAPPEDGDWSTWVLMAGRGFGKTLAGSNWITALIAATSSPSSMAEGAGGAPLSIALVGATLDEARRVHPGVGDFEEAASPLDHRIVRGLLGEPQDKSFASRISGSDALTLRRKTKVDELPEICFRALAISVQNTYKAEFGWIDQIKHVRDTADISKLDAHLVSALNEALGEPPEEVDEISLAYPTIYDPDKAGWVKFRGFGLTEIYPDLEIGHYLAGLRAKGIDAYQSDFLKRHSVEETDETGKLPGQSWPIRDCLVFETELKGQRYTLSSGRWYRIDKTLAEEVSQYFRDTHRVELPPAQAGDNEKTYNGRVAGEDDLLSLDVKLVKPSDASSPIEVCDFISKSKQLIHIKDKSESSRLSHLFNQGLVSAAVLKRDPPFRDRVREQIAQQPKGTDFVELVPDAKCELHPSEYQVVFGVLVPDRGEAEPKLPFFSLISFRHAGRRIAAELGYQLAFAWIPKPGIGVGKKPKRVKKPKSP